MALDLMVCSLVQNGSWPLVCINVNDESCQLLSCANDLCWDLLDHKPEISKERHFKLEEFLKRQTNPEWEPYFNLNSAVTGEHSGLQGVGVGGVKINRKKKHQASCLALAVNAFTRKYQNASASGVTIPDPCGTGLFAELVAQVEVATGVGGPRIDVSKGDDSERGIKIGVFGDSILCVRHENAKKNKYRILYDEMKEAMTKTIGVCQLDMSFGTYEYRGNVNVSVNIRDVQTAIDCAPSYDILAVGLGFNDLMDANGTWVVEEYADLVDDHLRMLAAAVKRRCNHCIVLCGGPASIWGYPDRWDEHMAQARHTLENEGLNLVNADTALAVLQQLDVSSDGVHFDGASDRTRDLYAQAWATWINEVVPPMSGGPANAIPDRERSRSPRVR